MFQLSGFYCIPVSQFKPARTPQNPTEHGRYCSGCRVQNSGFRAWDSGFTIWDLILRFRQLQEILADLHCLFSLESQSRASSG